MTKFHGLGNDFLVALAQQNPGLTPDPMVARALCARHTGVGADGLIYGLTPGGEDADVHMVLLNADGSEAEISGNGIRCLAQAVLREHGRNEGDVLVETVGGVRHLRTVKGEVDGELWTQVEMGEPGEGPPMTPEAIEFPSERRATVDIGNPHVVFLVPDPDAIDLSVHGPVLERSFPAGINVHMVAPTSFEDLELRVWERGVGITNACGSGAVAATVAAHGWGVIGTHATVHMPGGDAVVEIDGARALLTGPSAFIAEVVVP
jgi:diaminopimelate epimerase